MPDLLVPVSPYRGLRGVDAHGGGGYGAPRGSRIHKGLDFVARPLDWGMSPLEGTVMRLGRAYVDNPETELDESDLRSIHIQSDTVWVKLLYVDPLPILHVGSQVRAGMPIGHCQDRAKYVLNKDLGEFTNHIHMEVRVINFQSEWVAVDPASLVFFPPEVA